MASRLSNYSIFSAIIDPFVTIDVYSGILLVNSLPLPHWTIQQAMQNMTAFFHHGPLLVTQTVPQAFDSNYSAANAVEAVDGTDSVAIPALKSAKWAWLQPYAVLPPPTPTANTSQRRHIQNKDTGNREKKEAMQDTDPVADKYTQYMALGVQPSDQKPRYEVGSYTAIEGYMQLLQPLMQAEGAEKQPIP